MLFVRLLDIENLSGIIITKCFCPLSREIFSLFFSPDSKIQYFVNRKGKGTLFYY